MKLFRQFEIGHFDCIFATIVTYIQNFVVIFVEIDGFEDTVRALGVSSEAEHLLPHQFHLIVFMNYQEYHQKMNKIHLSTVPNKYSLHLEGGSVIFTFRAQSIRVLEEDNKEKPF